MAVAVLKPTQGNNVSGTVTFVQKEGHILVSARVTGLTPGKHGFHIHQYGDCSDPKGKSAGGHFNPAGHQHGGPASAKRHVGDLGNLTADQNGSAAKEFKDSVLKLSGPHSILGRGVIVHAKADDLKSQPTGAAGARVACGVVGVAKK
jgi:Cu-Zn family superoxide dismutase